jgi:CO dehydrogenase/acetyl-CoA synthase gamma subunit (corrinoid Fe-S protein)
MTCLAFATGLIQERYGMEQCPALQELSHEQERKAIQKLLDDYFGGQLPAGEEFVL